MPWSSIVICMKLHLAADLAESPHGAVDTHSALPLLRLLLQLSMHSLSPSVISLLIFQGSNTYSLRPSPKSPGQNKLFPSLIRQHIPFVQNNKLILKAFLFAWHLIASKKTKVHVTSIYFCSSYFILNYLGIST